MASPARVEPRIVCVQLASLWAWLRWAGSPDYETTRFKSSDCHCTSYLFYKPYQCTLWFVLAEKLSISLMNWPGQTRR